MCGVGTGTDAQINEQKRVRNYRAHTRRHTPLVLDEAATVTQWRKATRAKLMVQKQLYIHREDDEL